MARPLTGTRIVRPDGTAKGALPETRGARRRVGYDFCDEQAMDRWLEAGRAALRAGQPLPVPPDGDLLRVPVRRTAGGAAFGPIARRWRAERYEELSRAQLGREITVDAHIRRIDGWMGDRGLYLETMKRDHVKAMSLEFGAGEPPPAVEIPQGLDPNRLVSMDEAIKLPGAPSESTLKRRAKGRHPAQGHRRPQRPVAHRRLVQR